MNPVQIKKVVLVMAGCLLSAAIPYFLFHESEPRQFTFELSGQVPHPVSRAAGLASGILLFAAQAFLIVAAFDVGTAWGFAVLFVPFASLVFLMLHWKRCSDAVPFLAVGILFLCIKFFFAG